MGKTVRIQDLENRESEYRGYLQKIEDELNTKATAAEADLQKRVDAYYKDNNYEKVDFISGKNADFMQQADWSLANVKKIIDAISKAIFGGNDKALPQGVSSGNIKQVTGALADVQALEVYIAGKCFDVLSGIIESFGSSSSVSYNQSYKDVSLGNGLHMFATVICDAYQATEFFSKEEIYQYLYIYQVKYSAQEAKLQGNIVITELYEDQITTFKAKVEDLLSQLTDNKITPEQYQSNSQIYQTLIDAALQKLSQLKLSSAR